MDMRKGINSLIAVVQRDLGRDACAGDAFVFINKSRKIVDALDGASVGVLALSAPIGAGDISTASGPQE